MANFEFYAKLSNDVDKEFTPSKIDIIEAIAYGYSNKSIANEYSMSIKTVEKAFASLNKKFQAESKLYNSRIRIIASLLSKGFINYFMVEQPQKVQGLSEEQSQTLTLISLGLTNHTIAEILGITDKCVEKRLGNLFDCFGIDSKQHDVENPRVLLFINAYIRNNIDKEQMKKLYKETVIDRLERIIDEPEGFLQHLDDKCYLIG